jgi:multisubunit Na+/H+ antiporter MnhG subunit
MFKAISTRKVTAVHDSILCIMHVVCNVLYNACSFIIVAAIAVYRLVDNCATMHAHEIKCTSSISVYVTGMMFTCVADCNTKPYWCSVQHDACILSCIFSFVTQSHNTAMH